MKFYLRKVVPVILKNEHGILLGHIRLVTKTGVGKHSSQTLQRLLTAFSECHITHPLFGRCNDKEAERTFRTAVVDGKLLPAIIVFSRGNPFDVHKKIIQTNGAGKSGFQRDRKSTRLTSSH